MKVAKFGGTSLASAEQIRKVCDIILADPQRRIIVVSAPGKRNKTDTKVTDLLIAAAKARLQGGSGKQELAAVIDRYREIGRDLGIPAATTAAVAADFTSRLESPIADENRFMDLMKAAGEDNCAKLVAQYLRRRGVEANYLSPRDAGLLVSEEYGNARVLPRSYDNLRSLRDAAGITIFPGFFGYSPQGELVTFPRGGSDITGSILAAAVRADVYENFTDVDSVFAAHPGLIPDAAPIAELTYREMRELSYAGFAGLPDGRAGQHPQHQQSVGPGHADRPGAGHHRPTGGGHRPWRGLLQHLRGQVPDEPRGGLRA